MISIDKYLYVIVKGEKVQEIINVFLLQRNLLYHIRIITKQNTYVCVYIIIQHNKL